jgi:Cd2+/Zn2+-exporting ATPase
MPDRPAPPDDAPGAALVRVELDPAQGHLAVSYDPERLAPDEAEEIADQLVLDVLQDAPCSCVLEMAPRGGRSCESCAHRLEDHLRSVPGVRDARASFRSGLLAVDYGGGETSPAHIAQAVRDFGVARVTDRRAPDDDAPVEGYRVQAAFVALALAGLVAGFVGERAGLSALAWAGYGASYAFGGWFGARAGLESIRHRTVDIDLLMILAALGALSIGAPFEGAMLLFLFSLSNVLQDVAIGRSRSAIRALMRLRPESARVRRGGAWVELPVEQVAVGEVFQVRPGDRLPLDGTVVDGASDVDQASLTGESVPVAKAPGSEVFGGTINGGGSLDVRVTRRADQSAIATLIRLVEEAQSQKAPTQRLIDRFEQPYALGVIGLTLAAIAVPMLAFGADFQPAFYRAMTLMVAASPCALVISTPAAVLSAIAAAARHGVLFKGGAHVESAATVRAVAFDKTGTLTAGQTRLTDTVVLDDATDADALLGLAAAVQARSEHHLAKAIVRAAAERGLAVQPADGFQATAGKGVEARVGGAAVWIGNLPFVEALGAAGLDAAREAVERLHAQARTAVVVATDAPARRVLGVLAFADTLRPGAAEAVAALRRAGVEHIAMLTGDHAAVGRAIGAEAGVDEVFAELLPAQKVEAVRRLQARYGSVAMVGDGVNDAPALAAATVGLAMGGAGTDVALETADVVLMGDDLSRIPYALALSRRTRRTLAVNLAISLGMIVLMVGFILTVGLPLPLAVVGHEGSTVLVSLNGLRLLAARPD